jgi:hypothetical protein
MGWSVGKRSLLRCLANENGSIRHIWRIMRHIWRILYHDRYQVENFA